MGTVDVRTGMRTSSYLHGCVICSKPTAHPEDRTVMKCEACAAEWTEMPNIKRVKKAVKEAKA